MTMQGVHIHKDLYLLPLGGCDVVLGGQWLCTLGPILWDFFELKMQFNRSGNKFTLKVEKGTANHIVSSQQMVHLINNQRFGVVAQLLQLKVIKQY